MAQSPPRSRSPTTNPTARNLGIAHDAISIGDVGARWGFRIARFAANTGFGIASACIRAPAAVLESAAGANPVSAALRGADQVVGVAHVATRAGQDIAETITRASLDLTKEGLSAAGASEGELFRRTLGDEVVEAVTIVDTMVRRFAGPLANVPLPNLLLTARAWGAMQRAAAQAHARDFPQVAIPEHSERWLRFAAATFGAETSAGWMEGLSWAPVARSRAARADGDGPGEAALACAGIEGRVDVLVFERSAQEVFLPCYMVSVDHITKSVVVAFRGTKSIREALTDLVCEPTEVEFGGLRGIAHAGMLRAARGVDSTLAALVEDGLTRLRSEAVECDRPRVIICGHSLGAGVATLLAAIWRDLSRFPGVDIRCIAFACPQVLDADLAAALGNHTTSIVVGDDVVPRLSLATAQDLCEALLCLNDPLAHGLGSSFSAAEVLAAEARGDMEQLAIAYATVKSLNPASPGRLSPAGLIIHLLPNSAPRAADPEMFDELRIAQDMASAHLPHRYFSAMREAHFHTGTSEAASRDQ